MKQKSYLKFEQFHRIYKTIMGKCFPIVVLLAFIIGLPCIGFADYPLISHRYLADPDGIEYNGRLYLFCSNDDDNSVAGGYTMHSIVCISTDDLKNWTDHGVVFQVPQNASWAARSWAPTVAYRNGLFYLYFGNNSSSIGVATNVSPTGTFVDARGSALINSSTPGASGTSQWYFDPSVFIDSDSQAYLYFGGNGTSNARVVKLNSDMISLNGSAISMGTIPNFLEASQMHKRNGIYYFSYETGGSALQWIKYGTSSSPTSGFTWVGNVLHAPDNGDNNHQAFLTFQGREYVTYHNRYVAIQNGLTTTTYKRSVCLDAVVYNADGTIQTVACTTNGLTQLKYVNPYNRVEAETTAQQSGITTETCSEGGMDVTTIANGEWTMVRGVDFGAGAKGFTARIASAAGGGNIEIHLDSLAGTLVGTCPVPVTGGSQIWADSPCSVNSTTAQGVHNVYFKYTGGSGANLFSFNWWQFQAGVPPPPPAAPTGLSATAVSSSQINLSWTASSGATSYNVKRATVSGGPYTTIATGVTATSYSDTALSGSTTYYYVVSAVNAGGESANSSQASATTQTPPPPPAAPTGLTATAVSSSQINLSWTASSGATSYNVKRATVSGGPYTTVASPTGTTYNNTGIAASTTYYYVVSAVNAGGESANSTQASATTQTASVTTYEAEAAVLSGPVVSSQYAGYTGTGYADYANASADYIEWTVNVASAGTHPLIFRYANGSTASRPLELKVNGVVVNSSLAFPATGAWTTWMTVTNSVTLNAGNNTVRTTAMGSSGGNLDNLQVQ
jgi:arabinoxylan arabinofuranohydrolase